MRGTFRLALATVLTLACGFVFAADPVAEESTAIKDSFPDAVSYPLTLVDSRLEGPIADQIHKAAAGWVGVIPSHIYTWTYVGQPHPLLAAALPLASFALTVVEAPPEFRATYGYISMAGKLYRPNNLNQLLLDAGFTFDSTEMPTIAKTAVLLATFGKTFDASGQVRDGQVPTDSSPGAGFPAITFLSVKKSEWQHPKHKDTRRGVLVDCVVDGRRQGLFVEFMGRDLTEPEAVNLQQGDRMIRFGLIPVPDLRPMQK